MNPVIVNAISGKNHTTIKHQIFVERKMKITHDVNLGTDCLSNFVSL